MTWPPPKPRPRSGERSCQGCPTCEYNYKDKETLLPGRASKENRLSTDQRWSYLSGAVQWYGDLLGLVFMVFLLASPRPVQSPPLVTGTQGAASS
jgi:hypothetical protein